MPFELRLTDLGRAALADGENRGTQAVRLTKMAIGDGSGMGGSADDDRTALRNQRAVVAVGGSTMVSGRIAVRGEFNPSAAYGVTEMGLLGQVGTDPEFLAAYWTDDGERLASTVADTRLVIAGSLDIAPAAAEVSVNVDASVSLGDPALSALVTALGGRMDAAETDIDALEARPQGLLLWSGTQAQYDAIAVKAANTLYVITT
ncbi:MAG: phage tail protein [Bryobacterales bacterium]|nr:phage tail protein [Bryobacterales bacterium]MDE0294631.1 phage tail protein [Bryobacterales bacterium]